MPLLDLQSNHRDSNHQGTVSPACHRLLGREGRTGEVTELEEESGLGLDPVESEEEAQLVQDLGYGRIALVLFLLDHLRVEVHHEVPRVQSVRTLQAMASGTDLISAVLSALPTRGRHLEQETSAIMLSFHASSRSFPEATSA